MESHATGVIYNNMNRCILCTQAWLCHAGSYLDRQYSWLSTFFILAAMLAKYSRYLVQYVTTQ